MWSKVPVVVEPSTRTGTCLVLVLLLVLVLVLVLELLSTETIKQLLTTATRPSINTSTTKY